MGWWDREQEVVSGDGIEWAASYAARNAILKSIGFDSYAEYLASELWLGISAGILAKSGRCWVCRRRGTARQCHHDQYTRRNLLGETTHGIHSVCPICHRAIEFKAGKKLELLAARAECRRLRKWKRWPKIVSKKEARRRRKKKRPRARQRNDLDVEFERLIIRDG